MTSQASPGDVDAAAGGRLRVLCVDDNFHVAEALRIKIDRAGGFAWEGWLPSADTVVPTVERDRPDVVILDVDMPGRDPFEALAELGERCPDTRTVIFSGHVRYELLERALTSGAWGYVSKNDGEDALISAIRTIGSGEIALSREAMAVYSRGNASG